MNYISAKCPKRKCRCIFPLHERHAVSSPGHVWLLPGKWLKPRSFSQLIGGLSSSWLPTARSLVGGLWGRGRWGVASLRSGLGWSGSTWDKRER